jgi:hypothetical protein
MRHYEEIEDNLSLGRKQARMDGTALARRLDIVGDEPL